MNYSETIAYLYEQLPMFHRIGAAAYKADLSNTIALCDLLGNPQESFKSIHIAGTNGKGSTSHMLAAILQKAGYKTGLYTSPHLKDFRERIRINGAMIPEKNVVDFVRQYKQGFEKIQLSFFEWTVGLAFRYFEEEKVDIAIIEAGLGGRLDSTNIILPELSIITNISYDHMQLLGDTLEKIAAEKAGIIKHDIPVVIGEKQNETYQVFLKKASEEKSELFFANELFKAVLKSKNPEEQVFDIYNNGHVSYADLRLSLAGNYQKKNICTVLCAVDVLNRSSWSVSDENVRAAFESIQQLTGLSGRWQKLSDSPLTICDVGHNKAGIEFIAEQIRQTKFEKLHMVIGVVNDKDVTGILELLPQNAIYYFCRADIPRALEADQLKTLATEYGLKGDSYPTVQEALNSAKRHSSQNDMIFVGGSTFVVAEVL